MFTVSGKHNITKAHNEWIITVKCCIVTVAFFLVASKFIQKDCCTYPASYLLGMCIDTHKFEVHFQATMKRMLWSTGTMKATVKYLLD